MWVIRDPLGLLRFVFIAGTVAFALMGRSRAVGLTAASRLLSICRIIDLPRRFDFAVTPPEHSLVGLVVPRRRLAGSGRCRASAAV